MVSFLLLPAQFFNRYIVNMQAEQATLLIVDDIQNNVTLLYHFLTLAEFKVLIAEDGESCLNIVNSTKIDLILLDIMMPVMDGFEVCKRLKANPNTAEIPVIFMSALTETVDKVRSFSLGAADYITKPFQTEEVLARINTHLHLSRLQKQLQEQTAVLEKRNLELDAFAHTVAHDLKNPLSIILSSKDLLSTAIPKQYRDEETFDYALSLILRAGQKMENIIKGLLLLAGVSQTDAHQNKLQFSPINMRDLIEQTLEHQLSALLQKTQGQVEIDDNLPVLTSYAPWIEEVWANYISNGLKYGGESPVLHIGGELLPDNKVKFWIKDQGVGLNENAQKHVFTPFTRLHKDTTRTDSDGLGLSIVQQIIQKLEGQVGVDSEVGKGSCFYFILQQQPDNPPS